MSLSLAESKEGSILDRRHMANSLSTGAHLILKWFDGHWARGLSDSLSGGLDLLFDFGFLLLSLLSLIVRVRPRLARQSEVVTDFLNNKELAIFELVPYKVKLVSVVVLDKSNDVSWPRHHTLTGHRVVLETSGMLLRQSSFIGVEYVCILEFSSTQNEDIFVIYWSDDNVCSWQHEDWFWDIDKLPFLRLSSFECSNI